MGVQEGILLGETRDQAESDEALEGHGASVAELPEADADRAAAEWPFQVGLVYTRDLFVDGRYQRPAQERFIAQMADDFDETLVGTIDVSARDDDRFAILDGQQRWEAMRRIGKTTCYASIFDGLELRDEAGFFFRKNKDRKGMKPFYAFRARMVAGDLEAVAINQAVKDAGFTLGEATDNSDQIGAIRAVERAWAYSSEHRNECLTPALLTIRENYWGREGSLDANMIGCFGRFWQAYSDAEVATRSRLAEVLNEIGSPANLVGLGRERAIVEKSQTKGMARAIIDLYNRKQRRGSGSDGTTNLDPERLR